MLSSDRLLSELAAISRRSAPSNPDAAVRNAAEQAFQRAVAPLVGAVVTEELFRWWDERYTKPVASFERLGYIAAFILGEYDPETMPLASEDWATIRESLSAEADSLDLDVLTRLMSDLVSRGALD